MDFFFFFSSDSDEMFMILTFSLFFKSFTYIFADTITKVLIAVAGVVGLFLCFFGHRFFQTGTSIINTIIHKFPIENSD